MVVDYEFLGRDKLIKGFTYPIKRADLDAALEKAGVTEVRFLSYSCHRQKYEGKQSFLSSKMLGEAMTSGGWVHRAPYIVISAIPASISPIVKKRIAEDKLLDKFAHWLNGLEKAKNVRRMQDQFFDVHYCDEKLIIAHS